MAYTHTRFIFRQDGQPSVEQGTGTAPTTSTPEVATGWVRPAGSQIIGVGGAILGDTFVFDGTDWDQQLNDDSTFSDAADASDWKSATFAALVADSAAGVHAAYATGINVNFPGAFTSPAVPRNVTCTFSGAYDGGDITVTGTDMADVAQNEVIADAAGLVEGLLIFKTVTAAVQQNLGAGGQTCSIGWGHKIGLPILPSGAGTLAVDGVSEAATWSTAAGQGSFIPTTLPNGAKGFVVTYPSAGSTTTVTATP